MDRYRGLLFDLDGVIVDTAKYHFLAWKALADELGIPFTEKDNERLKGVSRMASSLARASVSSFTEEMLSAMYCTTASWVRGRDAAGLPVSLAARFLKASSKDTALAGVVMFRMLSPHSSLASGFSARKAASSE